MVRFCEATKTKMTFDICHAQLQCNLERSSLVDYARKVKAFVSHLHISDAAGLSAEGIPIFSGDIDFRSVLGVLEDIDYTWVTEIWSGHLHKGAGTYRAMLDLESNFKGLI
jgi:N-acetylneuraminate synthase